MNTKDDYRGRMVRTHMKNMFKVLMLVLFTLIFVGKMDLNNTKAAYVSTTPTYRYDGYDYIISFPIEGSLVGSGRYTMRENLKKMDIINVEHCQYIGKCRSCGYAEANYDNYFRVNINGLYGYYQNDHSSAGKSYPRDWYIDPLSLEAARYINEGDPPAEILFYYEINPVYCLSCYTRRDAELLINEIAFIDKRGVASMKQDSYSVAAGGSLTVDPAYNEYADHVEWGIKYPGDTYYTLLSEGSNRDGLYVSGAKSKTINLSNIPYVPGGFDLGVFVYDKDNQLPGNTTIQNTPFYSHITSPDNSSPTVSISKQSGSDGKSVMVTINAADTEGLHAKPFSWDGGKTYTEEYAKSFTKIGAYQVAVRDAAGNITRSSFYIDSSDIKGNSNATSPGSTGTPIVDKNTTALAGGNATGGGIGGTNNGTTSGTGGTIPGGGNTAGTGSMGNIVSGATSESVRGGNVEGKNNSSTSSKSDTHASDSVLDSKTGKGSGKGGSDSLSNNGSKPSPSDISESDSSEMFEKIRQNSKDYIIAMHDDYKEEERKASAGDHDELTVSGIERSDDVNDLNSLEGERYTDLGNSDGKDYRPGIIKNSPYFKVVIALALIIFAALLTYVLFFGVIVLYEKETEFSSVSKMGGIKMPAGISHISYSDGRFSICVREMLNRYEILYLRPGVLFAYMFDGEKIGIETKFKGDRKREIAMETVHREIKIGNKTKGGSKR